MDWRIREEERSEWQKRAERLVQGLALFAALGAFAAVVFLTSGCKNPNTGSAIKVGDITSLPEISDAADNISAKVLLMMTGASIWTAKDSLVKVGYSNCYTNWYCGIVERRGTQNLTVEVEPLEVGEGIAADAAGGIAADAAIGKTQTRSAEGIADGAAIGKTTEKSAGGGGND